MMMMMQGESGNLRLDTPHRVIDGGAASVFWPTPTRDQTSEVMKKLFPEQTAASFTPLPPCNLVPKEHAAMASGLLVDGASFSHQSAAPPAGTTSANREGEVRKEPAGQPSSAPDPFEWVKVRDKILGRGKSHTYSDDCASPRRLEISTLDDSGIEIPVAEPDEEAQKGVKSPVQSQQQPAGEKTAVHHVGPIDDDEASGRATPAANSGGCSPGIIDRLAPSASSAAMPLKQNQVKWGVIRSTEPQHAQAGNSERQPCIQPSSRAWAADILTVPPPYLAHQRIQAVSSRVAGLTGEHNKFASPHFRIPAPISFHSEAPAPGKVPRLAIFSPGSVDSTVHPSSSPPTTPVPCTGSGRAASAPSVPKTMPTTSFHRLCNTPRGGVKVVAAEELSVGRVNDRSRGRRILANSTVFC
jgi:hypothetical protein